MLELRAEQLEVLEQPRHERFVNEAVAYLHEVMPRRCQALGEDALRKSVLDAIEHGRAAGLTTEKQLLRYLNFKHVFGLRFEASPAYGWAMEILDDPQLDAEAKLSLVVARARGRSLERADV